jgi:hypothetical protein
VSRRGGEAGVRAAADRVGRGTGIAVFVLGVLLLLTVFYLAYKELIASGALPPSPSPPALSAGNLALLIATKGLFLFLMGFVSSAIANKGIGLYEAAVHAEPET